MPRSEKLDRLAGPHPLNAEVDLQDLFEAGMITPTKLHYVRSHGPVPQLNWETHRLAVFSDTPELIAGPKNWAMDELAGEDKFKIVEMPITFACDGSVFVFSANYHVQFELSIELIQIDERK